MAGQIKLAIDKIIDERAKGNPSIASTTRTKLILKGIDPSKFNASSPDDPAVMEKIKGFANELGIQI